ncbi:chymotrypsin-1-like [Nasonia vitripennis]|uniref:Peptidase S1 domain-containing protein n=1 Tax=Nasonia vitripennis TaxID=7425 RepID=A0A7M7LRB3_NASVI|nr:chymotrypsin-1-like [Nasonia vitripennis]
MKSITVLLSLALLVGSIDAGVRRPRIIEGTDASIRDFPYQAMIQMGLMAPHKHICSGVILSKKHILATAHCMTVFMFPPFNFGRVITGTDRNTNDTTGHIHQIASIEKHEDFDGAAASSYRHDIAVITLEDEIVFDEYQQKIELVDHDVESGITATLTGWGRTKNGTDSVQLQKLSTTVLTSAECQPYYPDDRPIFEDQFCAVAAKGAGACRGDSGGPLVVGNKLVGIVSWINEGICVSGTPEVYTNIYSHKDFIESAINK